MAGNQDGLSLFFAEGADKGPYLRNTDRIQAIGRFIQDQQLRVMHNGVGNPQTLFHAQRILPKELFVLIGQSHHLQGMLHCVRTDRSPQLSEDFQIFGPCQIGIETRCFDDGTNTLKDTALSALHWLAEQQRFARGSRH